MLHAIQFLLCPSCCLYPLTDAVLRPFLHQLCTCKSLSRAQFPGELHLDSIPEGTVTRFLQDQRVPLPMSETVEALRTVHHMSLVCVVWAMTFYRKSNTRQAHSVCVNTVPASLLGPFPYLQSGPSAGFLLVLVFHPRCPVFFV